MVSRVILVATLLSLAGSIAAFNSQAGTAGIPIKHVIIIVEENHTFDNYFGTYPGANGLNGSIRLPVSVGAPATVAPFHIPGLTVEHDLCHSWACAHTAYDNGKMDGFVRAVGGSNLTMGYFDYSQIPYYWDYASQFVLMDNFYSSAMAPSLPNHLYLVAGQSGGLTGGVSAGTISFNSNLVHNSTFYFKSIVDELTAKNITWKYYAGGYQYLNNWNPMPAFASLEKNQAMLNNLADPSSFATDVKTGKLASVVWMMPASDDESEHPPYDVSVGEHNVVSAINTVMQSAYWNSTAIFVTFDDYGGWYDHVPPPQVDGFGYGFRVPCLVISPYARQGMVDHVQSDFTSLLKFVETLYSLQPLTSRDSAASNMMEAFDFSLAPRPPLVLPGIYVPDHYPLERIAGQVNATSASTATSTGPATSLKSTTSASSSTHQSTSGILWENSYVAMVASAGAFAITLLVLLGMKLRKGSRGAPSPSE